MNCEKNTQFDFSAEDQSFRLKLLKNLQILQYQGEQSGREEWKAMCGWLFSDSGKENDGK